MTLDELRTYCRGLIETHPSLKEQIVDLFVLCVSEIEEGGSEPHEVELCLSDVQELLHEETT